MLSRQRILSAFESARNHPGSTVMELSRKSLHQTRIFLKSCYIDGFRAIVAGRYDKRQAAIIIAAMIPVLLTTAVITVPLILFPTEGHRAYHQFATILNSDPTSMIPVFISAVTATLGLKVPVG